jgi:hypothetical protein
MLYLDSSFSGAIMKAARSRKFMDFTMNVTANTAGATQRSYLIVFCDLAVVLSNPHQRVNLESMLRRF